MDSEKLAISYLLYNPNAIKEFISYGISADFFLNTINKAIFKVMSRYFVLYAKGISKIELEQELQKIQIGAETYTPHITFTTEDVYDISPEWLVKQLTDNKKRSILVNGVQKIAGDVNTNNVWDAEKELIKITKQISQMNSSSSVICNFNDDVDGMSKMLNIPKNERKILTGYKEFDATINGFKPGWLVVLAARPKTGKCHGIDTPILMHDGSIKKVQDVKVGEQLMGDDSTPRTVLSLARGTEAMYRIIPNKGDPFVCNGSHILTLKKSGARLAKGLPRILEISVNDYLKRKQELIKYKVYRVGVDFKRKSTSKYLPPYLLGAWLGDGTSRYPEITTPDPEIHAYLQNFTGSVGANLISYSNDSKKCPRYSITYSTNSGIPGSNRTLEVLRGLNLIDNKHIPDLYKINSRQVRLEVLAGLIDTDGCLTGQTKNTYEIVTKHVQLKDDILYLTRSLGFGATARLVKKTIKSTGFSGMYWRIFISGDIASIPVLLTRKKGAAKTSGKHRDALLTGFTVKSLGKGNYYGFELNGNHRYLLGDFTVTHNTRTMINLVANMIKQGTNVIAFTLEMPKEQYVNLFFSCMTGIPYYKFEERILTEPELAQVKELQSRLTTEYGKLIIVDTLKGVSPDYIAAKTEEMEIQFGTTFDVIAIDHATMMKPNRSMDNDWLAQGSIAEDLRSIGREMNKVVLTALQVKRGEKTKKSGNTGSDPGGDLSRSDIWYQTLDVLIVIQKPEGDDETSVLSTLKFKIISRYSEPQTVELVKDFNITSLYSIADSSLEKGIVSLWHKAGSGDEN